MKAKKHYLETFFETLSKYYSGIKYKGCRIAVKYYLQESTFSYDVFIFGKSDEVLSFLDEPNYRSEITHFWYSKTKTILKDIKQSIKKFKLEIDKQDESN